MALTEKTLELNVTHELLAIADRLWHFIHFATSAPRVIRSCHCFRPGRLPKGLAPPAAIGLTLRDEDRRGWDVRIELPRAWPGAPKATFLQFKLAEHRHYSARPTSMFHGTRASPHPHCVFGVNNNTRKNQHVVLRGLAGNPGLADAVLYALPRVPTVSSFRAWVGRLALVTSWRRVVDVDAAAARAGTPIALGADHHLATDYVGKAYEIHSEPAALGEIEDLTPRFVADLFATRVWRSLTDWQAPLREHWDEADYRQIDWLALFDAYLAELARYWAVDPRRSAPDAFPVFREDEPTFVDAMGFVAELLAARPSPEDRAIDVAGELARRGRVFAAIVHRLAPYRAVLAADDWLDAALPPPGGSCVVDLAARDGIFSFAELQPLMESIDAASLDRVAMQIV